MLHAALANTAIARPALMNEKKTMRIAALAEAVHSLNSTSFLAQNGSSKTNYMRPVPFLFLQFMQF